MMRKIFPILLACVLVLGLMAGCSTQKTPEPEIIYVEVTPVPQPEAEAEPVSAVPAGLTDIVILYTNDVHCGINNNLGYKSLAAVKNAFEAAGKTVLLVDNGDNVQGDTIGTLSKGEYLIDIMNEIGYAAAVPGNHEFDYTMEQFFALRDKANFPYISANFVDADGQCVLDPYVVLEVNGVKLGLVGVCTPKTISTSTPAYFMNDQGEFIYGFLQDESGQGVYDAVQAAVDAARAEGAEYVFVLSHLGIELDCSPWMSTELIENTTGIDAVLDGHSHSVIGGEVVKSKDGKDVLLTSTGTKLANIGCLTFTADGAVHTALVNDNGVQDFVDGKVAEFEELVNTVVAKTDVKLTTVDPTAVDEEGKPIRIVRSQETNLGDLCADAYRTLTGADVAFVNGGGIRANIEAGDITYGQIIAVHPYGNMMCLIEATGQQILDALELGCINLPGESGGFLQVSGLTYEADPNIPSPVKLDENRMFVGVEGERRVSNVLVGGEPIDPEATYTLASHNYMLKDAGDGYTMFQGCKLLQDSVMLDNQVLINYIVEHLNGVVGEDYAAPYGQGRIVIKPAA